MDNKAILGETSPRSAAVNSDVSILAKGASISLVGKVFGRGFNVLGQIFLARVLGPESFGLYAIGWTILRLAQTVIPLGLDNGVIHFSSRYKSSDKNELKDAMAKPVGLATVSGLFFGGGLFLLSPFLAGQIFQKESLEVVFRLFALSFPFMAVLRVVSAATRVSLRMKYSVYAEDLGQPLVNFIFILTAYFLGTRLFGAVVAGVLSFIIAMIMALIYLWKLYGNIFFTREKSTLSNRDLLLFALPTTLTATFGALTVWIDHLLVGYFLSARETGIYQAATQSSVLFAIVLTGFNAIFAPIIAQLYHERELERLDSLFKVSTKWGLYLCLPLFLVISFASKEVMTVIFGPQYSAGSLPLVILTTAQLINVGTGAVGYMLIMTGRQNQWLWISSSAFILNFSLNWVLIPRLGLVGASLGMSASIIWLFSIGLFQVRRTLGLWPYDRKYLKGLYASTAALIGIFLIRSIGIQSLMLNLGLILGSAFGVFGITLFLSGLEKEDHEFLQVAIGSFRTRFTNLTKG